MSFLSKRAALPLIRAILWGGFCGRDTCELRSGLSHTQNGPWFMFCAPVPNKNHFQLLQTPRNPPHMFLHIRETVLLTRYGGVNILKGKFSQKWKFAENVLTLRSSKMQMSFYSWTELEKFSITSLAHQWMLCSEWVPSEWCCYQLFGLSFWRHPFTAEDPCEQVM